MKKIGRDGDQSLLIRPRWPYKDIYLCEEVYIALVKAQKQLFPHDIKLVLTRGFENQGIVLRLIHACARRMGSVLFLFVYPERRSEIRKIFLPNGHNAGGNCVDVDIMYKGSKINLLPYGVFTNERTLRRLYQAHRITVDLVWKTLGATGFVIHSNLTESMQIHCELNPSHLR